MRQFPGWALCTGQMRDAIVEAGLHQRVVYRCWTRDRLGFHDPDGHWPWDDAAKAVNTATSTVSNAAKAVVQWALVAVLGGYVGSECSVRRGLWLICPSRPLPQPRSLPQV